MGADTKALRHDLLRHLARHPDRLGPGGDVAEPAVVPATAVAAPGPWDPQESSGKPPDRVGAPATTASRWKVPKVEQQSGALSPRKSPGWHRRGPGHGNHQTGGPLALRGNREAEPTEVRARRGPCRDWRRTTAGHPPLPIILPESLILWRMRVVVLGASGAHKTEASIVRATRSLGHECRLVNVVGWSRYAGPLGGPGHSLLGRGVRARLCAADAPRRSSQASRRSARSFEGARRPSGTSIPSRGPQVLALGRLVRRMYVTYLAQVDDYRAAGIEEVRFLPQGVDPDARLPGTTTPPGFLCEASFVGSGQYPHRYAVLRAVAAVCKLQIRGPGWERRARRPTDSRWAGPRTSAPAGHQGRTISLGASAHPEQDADRASASNRMWKVMGCGGFYLGPYVPDIECFAVDGRHCAWYRIHLRRGRAGTTLSCQPDGAVPHCGGGPGARAPAPHLRATPRAVALRSGNTTCALSHQTIV